MGRLYVFVRANVQLSQGFVHETRFWHVLHLQTSIKVSTIIKTTGHQTTTNFCLRKGREIVVSSYA